MSCKSGVIGELCYLAKHGKHEEGQVANHVFPTSGVGKFLSRMSCYKAAFFTFSTLKCYENAAALTLQ
jgi:hypothetical protein